jgi:hypothetical protein
VNPSEGGPLSHKTINTLVEETSSLMAATTSRSKLQDQIEDLEETVQQVSDLAEEGLDPELSREEVVGKLKEIADVASGEAEDAESEAEDEE